MLAHVGATRWERAPGTYPLMLTIHPLTSGVRAQTSTPMRWKRPDADYVPELMIQPEVHHPLHAQLGGCKYAAAQGVK